MPNDLNISLIQSSLHWENIPANLGMFGNKIASLKGGTDLILLPEMFSTGFTMNAKKVAEKMDGSAVQWMRRMARERNCVITGSLVIEEEGRYYNRLIWMRADGSFEIYNKRHLFRYANEQDHYTAGGKKLVVEFKGWKVCPLVCYDLRFPVWSRNRSNSEYDLLIYVANWPERRSHPWKTLLPARAIENQAYVAGLNRVGNDGNSVYHSGDSAVINYRGEIISKIKGGEETAETITLSFDDLRAFRKSFPAGMDADDFELKL
jgi:predicted amidohydrolase